MESFLSIPDNYKRNILNESKVNISIFIPIFNSEKSLEELIHRIDLVMKETELFYEFVLLDDCSKDNSWKVIQKLHYKYPNICAVRHLTNHGYNHALQHGLEFCRGEWVITMDDDLQHPPEEIEKFLNFLSTKDKEVDVIFGCYKTKSHKYWVNMGSRLRNFLIRKIFKISKNLEITSFRMIHRRVVNEIIQSDISEPQAGLMILKSTKRIVNIKVAHHKRKYGKSGMKISKMIKLTLDIFIHHSTFPLRIITGIGFLCFFISLILSIFYLTKYFLVETVLSGYTTIVLLILNFGGLTLFTIGILGYYMSRILKEVTHKKFYGLRNFLPPERLK